MSILSLAKTPSLVKNADSSSQSQPQIAYLSNGSYVVVWQDNATGDFDIKGQLFNADGNKQGSLLNLNSATGTQVFPQVVALDNGFAVSWNTASTIHLQAFNSAGVAVGSELSASVANAFILANSNLLALSPTTLALSWQASDGKIGSQIFNFDVNSNTLAPVTTGGMVLSDTSSNSSPGLVAYDATHLLTLWNDKTSTDGDIFAKVINPVDGSVQVESFVVNTTTAGVQSLPQAIKLSNGYFVVAWNDASASALDTSGLAVRGQIVDIAGNKVGSEFLLNTATIANQQNVQLAALGSGGFIAVWQDSSNGVDGAVGDKDSAIKGQVFDATGNKLGSEILVNASVKGDQTDPKVLALADGGFFVVWQSGELEGPKSLIGQTFDAQGGHLGTEVSISSNLAFYESYDLALNGNKVVVTWDTGEQGASDIAQAILDIATLTNQAPQFTPIEHQAWSGAGVFSYAIPPGTFTDANADSLSYTATLADGSALPSWLSFNAANQTFSGNPIVQLDENNQPLASYALDIKVTAQDDNQGYAYNYFTLTLNNVNDPLQGAAKVQVPSAGMRLGQTLTADTDTLSDGDGLGTLQYQWLRDDAEITDATGNTFTLSVADVNSDISVRVSYTDPHGTAETTTSTRVHMGDENAAPTGSVNISGQAKQGQTLSVANTLADPDGLASDISYQWFANGVALDNGSSNSYTLTQNEVDKDVLVKASYVDGRGFFEEVASNSLTIANVNDAPSGEVTILGNATQGQELSIATDTLADADGLPEASTYSYQWLRDGQIISGATGDKYTLTQAEVGKAITARVTYTDLFGTPETLTSLATSDVVNINDAPSGSVNFEGTLTVSRTLTAQTTTLTDADGLGPLQYQWQANGVDIEGATNSSYTLSANEQGKTISLKVSYTDGQGTPETLTSPTNLDEVQKANSAPTGNVTISGSLAENSTLRADTTSLQDADELGTLSYQWYASGQAISGAIGDTLTLTQEQVGKNISLAVSYTDGAGQIEKLTATTQGNVGNVNNPPTGLVTLEGTAEQNQTLTANTSAVADGDGLGTFAYQWRLTQGNTTSDIAGATGQSYTLTQNDVGGKLSVKVTYTDGQGSAESLVSASSATVANINDAPTGKVTLSGKVIVGETLTANTATLADADGLGALSYQWQADGADIAGATSATYAITENEVDKTLSLKVSYTDGFGNLEAITSATTAKVKLTQDAATIRTVNGVDITTQTSATDAGQWIKQLSAQATAVTQDYTITPFAQTQIAISKGVGFVAQEEDLTLGTGDVAAFNALQIPKLNELSSSKQTTGLDAANAYASNDGLNASVAFKYLQLSYDATTANGQGAQIHITGANEDAAGKTLEGLILDAKALPAGSQILLDKVPFVILQGVDLDIKIQGGDTQIITSDAAQHLSSDTSAPGLVKLISGLGSDVIKTGLGNDELQTDDGDDVISMGAGVNSLDAGSGADAVVIQGKKADFTLAGVRPDVWDLSSKDANAANASQNALSNAEFVYFDDALVTLKGNPWADQLVQDTWVLF